LSPTAAFLPGTIRRSFASRWRRGRPTKNSTMTTTHAPAQTRAPGTNVVLYDGYCNFCTAQSRNLLALARPGAIELVNFQEPGALERFPGISFDACMEAMHLVTADGRVYRGFEAAVQAVATRPVLGQVASLYYLPGVRQLCDGVYQLVAAYRYRI